MRPLLRRVLLLALFLTAEVSAQDTTRSLTILHTNDLHAHFLPNSHNRGGFSQLATVIRRERSGCNSCLLLDGGDLVQGTPVSTLFRGLPVYRIANLLGFDASTLGNHEFDYGWKMTAELIRAARFRVVSSNVANDNGRLLAKQAYIIRNVNGIRVAVIGAMLGDLTTNFSTPALTGPWRVLPVLETVRKYAAEIRDRADLIVVLGHLNPAEQTEILQQAPEIAVVVTGHDHRGQEKVEEVDGRLGVLVKAYGVELGRLDLRVDVPAKKVISWTWKKIPIDANTIRPAPDVAKLVARWEARVSKIVDVPIGESKREYSPRELKPLMEQAMREEMGVDFAYMNLTGVRDNLPRGRVLARNVWNIMPFDNKTVVGKFKGSELPDVVKAGQAIDPDREYKLAVSDFTATNASERKLLGITGREFPPEGPLLRDILIAWIKKKGVLE